MRFVMAEVFKEINPEEKVMQIKHSPDRAMSYAGNGQDSEATRTEIWPK